MIWKVGNLLFYSLIFFPRTKLFCITNLQLIIINYHYVSTWYRKIFHYQNLQHCKETIQRLWADYLNKDFVKLQMSIILYYNYYIPKWMWVSRANLYKLEIWRPGTWQVFFNTTSLLYKLYKSNISWTQYDLQINSSYFFINLFLSKKKKQLNQSKTFFGHSCIKDISQDINLHGVN